VNFHETSKTYFSLKTNWFTKHVAVKRRISFTGHNVDFQQANLSSKINLFSNHINIVPYYTIHKVHYTGFASWKCL